jgi:hypothetical protein
MTDPNPFEGLGKMFRTRYIQDCLPGMEDIDSPASGYLSSGAVKDALDVMWYGACRNCGKANIHSCQENA